MIVESKYFAHIIKKMNKEFVITKKGNEGFQNFTKYWNYDHVYVKADVKKRGHAISLENIKDLYIEIIN